VFARLARDPLLHFLVAGAALFLAWRGLHGPEPASRDDRTIVVDHKSLLRYMQYEETAFQPAYFEKKLAALSPDERRKLVSEYVREEALVREATQMGLADGDNVIRRRMAQKMQYLMDDVATQSFTPSEGVLQKYFLEHQDRYQVAPTLTFTHVFVDKEIKRSESAKQVAQELLLTLRAAKAGFNDAPRYGDRFPYLQNCVQRSPDFIESQFGQEFVGALNALDPSASWQGPIESSYGYHLVLLTQREPARVPKLADVEAEVRDDLLRDTIAEYRERAITELTKQFSVACESAECR
jgi:peptidyl-prolyl cis-trans isomerase C